MCSALSDVFVRQKCFPKPAKRVPVGKTSNEHPDVFHLRWIISVKTFGSSVIEKCASIGPTAKALT